MKRCCVIGGTGFLGQYVVEELLRRGMGVTVVGRKKINDSRLPKQVKYYSTDYGDVGLMKAVLKGIDWVFCLAHTSYPASSYLNPVNEINNNVTPMVSLLNLIPQTAVQKIVYVSSGGAVYGKADKFPLTEDTHPQGGTDYIL